MDRDIFDEDHESYRQTVRMFIEREVRPHYSRWELERRIEPKALRLAAEVGLRGLEVPEAYGGQGISDYRFRLVVNEEMMLGDAAAFNMTLGLQDDLVLPYLLAHATDEQSARWLPGFASGHAIGALAMTEPATGSDLRAITTSIREASSGFILTGQKTFISCGTSASLIIVAARDPDANGLTLVVLEGSPDGLVRSQPLQKIGLHAQDTAELFFSNVHVEPHQILGERGGGVKYLTHHLARERLAITASAVPAARAAFEIARRYTTERMAFGARIADLQVTRFALAEMATEIEVAQAYLDQQVRAFGSDSLTPTDAAMGKWWTTDLLVRVVDRCLQLHGGYGYMAEYPIARAFLDSRAQPIYGGTNEIMKELIARAIIPRA